MFQKTEVILFKTKSKPYYTAMKLYVMKLCRKIFNRENYVRVLGVNIDEHLNWFHNLASKLNRVNSILSKLRHFLSSEILRSVYFAIFQSHVKYICLDWGLTRYSEHKYLFSKSKL